MTSPTLLDIRHRPNGDVIIYPPGAVYHSDQWKELCEYCATHTSAPAPAAETIPHITTGDKWKDTTLKMWEDEIRKEAAKSAREDENKRLIEEMLGFVAGWGSLNYQIPKKYLKKFIESLRSEQPEGAKSK